MKTLQEYECDLVNYLEEKHIVKTQLNCAANDIIIKQIEEDIKETKFRIWLLKTR